MGMGGGTGPMTRKQMQAGHGRDLKPIPAHQIGYKPTPKETIHRISAEGDLEVMRGRLVDEVFLGGGRYMGVHNGYHSFVGPSNRPDTMTTAYIPEEGIKIDGDGRIDCSNPPGMSLSSVTRSASPYTYDLLKSIYEGKTL